MTDSRQSETHWGSSYRLVAAEKWKSKSAAMGRALTQELVEYAHPEPGMQVLDLASGTGEPAISLAQRVGPTGHVSALDLSPDLLQIAAQRAQQRGLSNLSFHPGDAQALPFPDDTFDLATCRFGVMFFQDCDCALRQLHRVLRPGARACFAAWGPFEQPYWRTTMGTVLRHVGGPLFPPGGQDLFRFSQPGSLSDALRKAGLDRVNEETRTVCWVWPGEPQELWEYAQAVSAPFRTLLERVPKDSWPVINREVWAEISKFARNNGIDFGAQVVFASGRKI